MLHPHRILNPSPNRHELREPLVVRQADLSISSRSLTMFKNVNGAVNLTSPLVEQYIRQQEARPHLECHNHCAFGATNKTPLGE
jgi:hypothetical protein